MDGFAEELLARLPLADAVLSLFSWVTEESFLQEVFDEHRGRTYESVLTFPTMVNLVGDALLEHDGSGRRAMLQAEVRGELEASRQAAYGKLRRMPISLSNAFLRCTTQRIQQVLPENNCTRLPACVRSFTVIAIDGKKIKKAAKRLKPARSYSGTPLGGKALVALNLRQELAVAMNAHLDGEVNDAPLVGDLLPQVRQSTTRPILWIADRQFCDLTQPHKFLGERDSFLLRYHPKTKFHRDPDTSVQKGKDAQGRNYQEELGWLGAPQGKRSLYVRRITLYRQGEEDVILVTNLTDAGQYPAKELLDLYLLRWNIERVFQQITEVFHLKQLISSTPEGTIFQFSFCLLLYNLIQTIRRYVARAQRRRSNTISSEMLFYDVHRELISMSVLADRSAVLDYFHTACTAKELDAHLQSRLAETWYDRWIKSPPKNKSSTAKPKKTVSGGHTSLYRIMQTAKPQ